MKAILAALLLALAIGQAAATCANVKGVSATFGNSDCGSGFDESGRSKDIHLRRVTTYYSDGCLMGLKTDFAGKGGDKSTLYGSAKGESKSFGLGWTEYITGVDIKGGNCIKGVKFTTTTGQSFAVGEAGTFLSKAINDAYVFGFKGTAGKCGVSSLAVIWAVEECAAPVPKPETKPVPVPTPVEVPTPVPVPTPKPVPTPVDKPVPVPVDRPVPVPTPVDKPVPVPVDRPVPVPTPVDRPVPVPVDRPKPVPTPVDKPVPVPVDRPVPVPTPVDKPVPVPVDRPVPVPTPVDKPVPVPVPVPATKTVNIGHGFKHHWGKH